MSRLMIRAALTLSFLVAGCRASSRGEQTRGDAAMRESVAAFLTAHANLIAHPLVGDSARRAAEKFYTPDVVYSSNTESAEPVIHQGIYALIEPEATRWVRRVEFSYDHVLITPLATGTTSVTARYIERVTDTSGRATEMRGAALMVLRATSDGWRISNVATSNPSPTLAAWRELSERNGDRVR